MDDYTLSAESASSAAKPRSRGGSLIESFRGVVSCLLGAIISINMIMGAGVMVLGVFSPSPSVSINPLHAILTVAFLVWCVAMAGWYGIAALKAISGDPTRISLCMAARHPRFPLFLRILPALWWLFHSLMSLMFGVGFAFCSESLSWPFGLFGIALSWVSAHLFFDYFILATAAVFRSEAIWERVSGWRQRWALLNALACFCIVAVRWYVTR